MLSKSMLVDLQSLFAVVTDRLLKVLNSMTSSNKLDHVSKRRTAFAVVKAITAKFESI